MVCISTLVRLGGEPAGAKKSPLTDITVHTVLSDGSVLLLSCQFHPSVVYLNNPFMPCPPDSQSDHRCKSPRFLHVPRRIQAISFGRNFCYNKHGTLLPTLQRQTATMTSPADASLTRQLSDSSCTWLQQLDLARTKNGSRRS